MRTDGADEPDGSALAGLGIGMLLSAPVWLAAVLLIKRWFF